MNANTKEKYDTETKNFKTLRHDTSDNTDILLDNSCDPEANFFYKSLDTPYLIPGEFHDFLNNSLDQFPVLHLNFRSIKRNFENFKLFLNLIKFYF